MRTVRDVTDFLNAADGGDKPANNAESRTLKYLFVMSQINYIKERLLRMSDQSTNSVVRERLTGLLTSLVEVAADSQAGVVAGTLLGKIRKYSRCYCSEKQAYIIACGLYEHCLDLY